MTNEEKKAIEYLKRHILPYYGSKSRIEFMLNDIILNLIEKQSKEIEELKEKNKKIEAINYKIKAKIEELEKRRKDLCELHDTCARSIGLEDCQEKIMLYEELLEEELK